eukprot:Nk52_evm78s212 gene=Nk52_evmTU78s212
MRTATTCAIVHSVRNNDSNSDGNYSNISGEIEPCGDKLTAEASAEIMKEADSLIDAANRKPPKMSEWINYFLCVLVVANYFVTLSSISKYSERLDASPSFGGILLGVQTAGNIIVTLVYSWWTKYSFRQPILFASVCAIIGNCMYATAVNVDNIYFLLASRLIVGLNNIGVVSRKFISVSYGDNTRTHASMLFQNFTSVGIAGGCLFAAFLSLFEVKVSGLNFDADTLPGWSFSGLWTLSFLLVYFFFDEPEYVKHRQQEVSTKEESIELSNLGDDGLGTQSTGCPTEVAAQEKPQEYPSADNQHPFKRLEERKQIASIPIYHSKKMDALGVFLSTYLIFVGKLNLGAFEASAPLVTAQLYDWGIALVSLYLAGVGGVGFAFSLALNRLFKGIRDTRILLYILTINTIGQAMLLMYGNYLPIPQYVVAGVVFLGSNAVINGVAYSILTKVFVRENSTFNAAFIGSLAQYLARGVGVVFGTQFYDFEQQENIVMAPNLALMGIGGVLCAVFSRHLVPRKLREE